MTSKEPLVFNIFKPAEMSSYDVIRVFKRSFGKKLGKIGHFGTLDPFACGVLLIGVGGAARLNDYIHDLYPKTYLAVGKLGEETETGDFTAEVSQKDDSPYLEQTIAKLSPEFIEKSLQEKFLGDYWQAPHKYSAAKFQGKKLLEWAKEGVDIKKEAKLRQVHSLEVVKYQFPYLSIRFSVSSGTYIRTLFSECANHLGTIGSLVSLLREEVGPHKSEDSLKKKDWPARKDWDYKAHGVDPEHAMPLPPALFAEKEARLLSNGVPLALDRAASAPESRSGLYWAKDMEGNLIGLVKAVEGNWKVQLNFASSSR